MTFKISDFGFSRFLNTESIISSVGSPLYMAPELLLKEKTKEGLQILQYNKLYF